MQSFRASNLIAGDDEHQRYISFREAYDHCLSASRPDICIDRLSLELYKREGVELTELAKNRENNPITPETYPEMELLTPRFNSEWAESVNAIFIEVLLMDPTNLANFEPNFFETLKVENPYIYEDVVKIVEAGEQDREAVESLIGPDLETGIGITDLSGAVPSSE